MTLLGRIFTRRRRNREVAPQQAQAIQQDGGVLLDVRTRAEFTVGHAPKARNVPLDQLGARGREIASDDRIVTICQSGGRSARAAGLLRQQGLDVVDVRGGMSTWPRAGLPVHTRK